MTKKTTTILLVGGAAVLVYLITRPRTTVAPLQTAYPYGTSPYGYPQVSQTPQIISAAASAINTLIPSLSNIFGGKSSSYSPPDISQGYYV